MKKIYLAFIFFLFFVASLSAQDSTKISHALRVSQPPKIDGVLDDISWKEAIPVSDFVMSRPDEGGKPTQKTEVKVVYDNRAVYVSAMMYDTHPDSILHELGSRDDGDLNADGFRFVVDPYNLRQDAFDFGVNAAGVQADSKFTDYTFNAVWASAAKINEQGWCVEMEIPLSAIRFPKKPVQEWAVQFTRYIRRNREFDQWCLVPSTAANAEVFWGTLKGIENIQSPLRLSLTPYVSGYIERAPDYLSDNTYHYANSLSYNVGADLKYGIDDRFTLDMTLLPDFGQVQSDNKIKNLGYQEVTYNQYRSFFKEGTDIFSKNGLFYTRRIGRTPAGFYDVSDSLHEGEELEENPSQVKLLNAFKISGRTNEGLGIGLFNAVTENTYAVIKQTDGGTRKILTEPLTNYNVFVFDQQFNSYSNVFLINTNVMRNGSQDDANVTGTGFTLADKKNTYATDGAFSYSQIYTHNAALAPETVTGYKYFIGGRKISGTFQYGLSHSKTSDTYNQLDMGYYTIPNFENTRVYTTFFWYKPWHSLREGNIGLSSDYTVNPMTGERTFFQINLNAFAVPMNYNSFFFGGGVNPLASKDYNEPRTEGRFSKTLPYWYSYFGISSDYRKPFAVDFTFNLSNFMAKYLSEGYSTNCTLRYRFSDRFTLRLSNNFNYDPYNFGFANTTTDDVIYGLRILHTHENVISGKYIFKNDMALTLNARHYWSTGEYREYFTLLPDGNVASNSEYTVNNNFNYNVFNIDLVYSWQFAPGSNLSFAYKNAIETSTDVIRVNLPGDFKTTLKAPQLNSVSLKVIYYLDYLYLKKREK
jgi:hypothetical protein